MTFASHTLQFSKIFRRIKREGGVLHCSLCNFVISEGEARNQKLRCAVEFQFGEKNHENGTAGLRIMLKENKIWRKKKN